MHKIIHITAHLGGGVGKSLSTLILNDKKNKHKVICLEKPKVKVFYNKIKSKTKVTQSKREILKEIDKNDIIQIEYWPHPLLIKVLLSLKIFKKKILFWCHFSGLGHPKFHKKLINSGIKLILTTNITNEVIKKNFPVISSATVLKNIKKTLKKKKNFFYIGSLHHQKIHQNFAKIILQNINIMENFYIYGEDELIRGFKKKFKFNLSKKKIILNGFKEDVQKIYMKYKYLLYLLKKNHYGSAENILVESMGDGVIPIVFNNKVEKKLIKNNYNGFILNNLRDLKKLLLKIKSGKVPYYKISKNCKNFARNHYSLKKMINNFDNQYDKLEAKTQIVFKDYFSQNPKKIFESITKNKRSENLLSNNKSGLNHFLKYFKKNKELIKLKEELKFNV